MPGARAQMKLRGRLSGRYGFERTLRDRRCRRRRGEEADEGLGGIHLFGAGSKHCNEHIAVYGPENHLRLTGLHETQSIDKFSYGVADRGASIRVPHSFVNNGYKGYLEDRRPNSAADPYLVAGRIVKTIQSVPTT